MSPQNMPPATMPLGSPPQSVVSTRRFSYLTYAGDWILTIVVAGIFYALDRIHGYWRHFSLTDTSIQYPYAQQERVPTWALYIIALVAPFVFLPAINAMTVRMWWDWHHSWLGLLLSFTTTGAVTQFTKVTVGRPRPGLSSSSLVDNAKCLLTSEATSIDLIARCLPTAGLVNPSPFGLVNASICTQTDIDLLKDGFRSFFSGHSSLSFAGLGFLSWYLAGKLHLFDRRGHTAKAWVSLAPLAGALLVAITRTMDNRHHWQDVLVGSLVGLGFSFFAYRQYYPPLSAPDAHLPFEPRHMGLRPPVLTLLEGVGETGAGKNDNADIEAHDREHAPGRSTSHHTDTDDVETGGHIQLKG